MASQEVTKAETIDMKTRIIQAAKVMFMETGYDNSSVNALLEKMRIAKGTFYHYFKSKEELLDSVVKDFTDAILAEINKVVSEDADAFTKFTRVMSIGRQRKVENMGLLKMLMSEMYAPENLVLRHRIMEVSQRASSAVLTDIIRQGDKEGVFNSVGAQYTGMIIVEIGVGIGEIVARYALKDGKSPEDEKKIMELAETYDRSVARLMGIEEGKIKLMDREFLEALKEK